MHYYNIVELGEDDDDDTRNIQITKIEGEHLVSGLKLQFAEYVQPIKTRKVNIGTKESSNMAII